MQKILKIQIFEFSRFWVFKKPKTEKSTFASTSSFHLQR